MHILLLCFLVFFSLLFGKEKAIITVPKSGTHLVMKTYQLIQSIRPNANAPLITHFLIPYKIDAEGYQVYALHPLFEKWVNGTQELDLIFLVRDPRDNVVSFAYDCMLNRTGLKGEKTIASYPIEDQVLMHIRGGNYFPTLPKHAQICLDNIPLNLKAFINFSKKFPEIPVLHFEDLIGEKGGGSQEKQHKTIRILAQFINLELSPWEVERIGNLLFGNTHTIPHAETNFRKGKIAGWKEYFNLESIQAMKEEYGDLLINLGYESDLAW